MDTEEEIRDLQDEPRGPFDLMEFDDDLDEVEQILDRVLLPPDERSGMVTGEEIRDWQSSDPDVIERIRALEDQITSLQEARDAWRRQCYREEKRKNELTALLEQSEADGLEAYEEALARNKELETAINAFLGAYEHGRESDKKQALDDLRALVNE